MRTFLRIARKTRLKIRRRTRLYVRRKTRLRIRRKVKKPPVQYEFNFVTPTPANRLWKIVYRLHGIRHDKEDFSSEDAAKKWALDENLERLCDSEIDIFAYTPVLEDVTGDSEPNDV